MGKPDQGSAGGGSPRATGDAGGPAVAPIVRGRKREVVLRLLRGEDLESVSRAVGITAARASQWRDRFLAAGQASLKSRAPDARNEDDRRLQAKIGELLMENELLYAKVDQRRAPLARRRSDEGPHSISTRRYGLQGSAGCGTALAHPRPGDNPRCRVGAAGRSDAAPDEPGRPHSWVLAASPFHGRRVPTWAKLRVERIRTSQERVRRLMASTTSRPRTAWAGRTARRHMTARLPRRSLT